MQEEEFIAGTISLGENKVNCLRMGNGKKLLIAFHGFGNTAAKFESLLPYLNGEYTIVSVDLPGHGKTEWHSKHMLPKDLMALVQGIKNNFGVDQFSLIGYSLGGRVALNVVGLHPAWVDKVVLLASDGLKKNFWYNFATRNVFGKMMFKSVLNQPEDWLKRFSLLKKYHLIDESRYKFASSKMLNKNVNAQVAYVWPVMSKLIPIIPIVKYNIKKFKIPVFIFMGRHDRIFNYRIAEKFTKDLKTAKVEVLETGHHVLGDAQLPKISAVLLS